MQAATTSGTRSSSLAKRRRRLAQAKERSTTSSPRFDPLLLGQADAALVVLENRGPEAAETFARVMAGA